MIYLWSDTHFNHHGIIAHCDRKAADGRRFQTVEAMNESLITTWNSTVSEKDTIYLLGDFGFSAQGVDQRLETIFGRLQGHKHLVVGNHDSHNPRVLKLPWESISMLLKLRDCGRRFILCHYPLETWEGAYRGYLMAHGHSHGGGRKIPHRFDVGVDCVDRPISIDSLWELANKQEFNIVDYHATEDM